MYRVYQLNDSPENDPFRYQSYLFALQHSRLIRIRDYALVQEGFMLPEDTAHALRERLEKPPNRALSVSDVLAIEYPDQIACYYVEPHGFIMLDGFLETASPSGGLAPDTRDYAIPGKAGLWSVADTIRVEDSTFFLMEHNTYGQNAARVILDDSGAVVADDNRGDFDETAIQQIRAFLRKKTGPILETYQKYYENGEYLRSSSPENLEEQNYNMIDGQRNNRKKRLSVRARLKAKQALLHPEAEKTNLLEKI